MIRELLANESAAPAAIHAGLRDQLARLSQAALVSAALLPTMASVVGRAASQGVDDSIIDIEVRRPRKPIGAGSR
jgi:hypothetical protein